MNPVGNIGNAFDQRALYLQRVSASPARPPLMDDVDSLELSQQASSRYRIDEIARSKLDRILSVRQAIRSGTFESPQRIQGTVDRLIDLLA